MKFATAFGADCGSNSIFIGFSYPSICIVATGFCTLYVFPFINKTPVIIIAIATIAIPIVKKNFFHLNFPPMFFFLIYNLKAIITNIL